MIIDLLVENKEFLKIVYALAVMAISLLIFLKSDRLFKLSDHQGLRYFRNAFFFFFLGFFFRYFLSAIPNPLSMNDSAYFYTTTFFYESFMLIASGFLVYSLIWKRIEKEKKYHSLLNQSAAMIYAVGFLLAFLAIFFEARFLFYATQITLFFILSTITYKNYKKGDGNNFQTIYFLTMLLGLLAWVLNAYLDYFFGYNKLLQVLLYSMNLLFFILLLYGTKKIKDKNGKKKRKN